MLKLSLAIIALSSALTTAAIAAPQALIYKGPGACTEDCAEAFVDIAKQAGFDPVFVGPGKPAANLFDGAGIWIQPGGYAGTAMNSMSSELKTKIKAFVQNGGGYVGFCAGAFVATQKVGTTSVNGLNIFPGGTKLYGKGIDLKTVTWNGSKRVLYWEGGPYLRNLPSTVEVIGKYSNGAVAAARTSYGKGRVFITGLHPEAPAWWAASESLADPDGLDHDLVVDMIHWASRL
jgi:glutamine amidotransferase PdxT